MEEYMKNEKKKYNNLSCYRMIAAIAILIFHLYFCMSNNNMTINLLSKGVQGLTLLSGFLYSQRKIDSIRGFYKKNIMKLITPVLWVFILTIAVTWAMHLMNPSRTMISFWFGYSSSGSLLFIYGNFWYIPMIIICYLMTPILAKAKKDKSPYLILVIIIGIMLELMLAGHNLYFPISFTIYTLGYFFGGLAGVYKKLTDDRYYPKDFMLSAIIFIICILLYYYLGLFMSGSVLSFFRNFIASLVGASSFFLFTLLFKPLNSLKLDNVFRHTDKIAYPFYLLNQIFSTGVFKIYAYNSLLISGILILITTAIFSFIIAYMDDYSRSLIRSFNNKKGKAYLEK